MFCSKGGREILSLNPFYRALLTWIWRYLEAILHCYMCRVHRLTLTFAQHILFLYTVVRHNRNAWPRHRIFGKPKYQEGFHTLTDPSVPFRGGKKTSKRTLNNHYKSHQGIGKKKTEVIITETFMLQDNLDFDKVWSKIHRVDMVVICTNIPQNMFW